MSQDYWQPFKRLKLNPKKPVMTTIIVIICAIVFAADQLFALAYTGEFSIGILSLYGMKINSAIAHGEIWRLLSAIFLHGDVSHVGFNIMAIYIWGKYVEALYGSSRYILIFLLAGLMGSVASFAFTSANSLGASGAIFGMFGALIYFRKYDKRLFNFIIGAPALIYMAFSLFAGFTSAYVDNVAHLGGLLGGYIAAHMLGLLSEDNIDRKVAPWIYTYFGILAICGLIGFILARQ